MDHITGFIVTILFGNMFVRWVYSVAHDWRNR